MADYLGAQLSGQEQEPLLLRVPSSSAPTAAEAEGRGYGDDGAGADQAAAAVDAAAANFEAAADALAAEAALGFAEEAGGAAEEAEAAAEAAVKAGAGMESLDEAAAAINAAWQAAAAAEDAERISLEASAAAGEAEARAELAEASLHSQCAGVSSGTGSQRYTAGLPAASPMAQNSNGADELLGGATATQEVAEIGAMSPGVQHPPSDIQALRGREAMLRSSPGVPEEAAQPSAPPLATTPAPGQADSRTGGNGDTRWRDRASAAVVPAALEPLPQSSAAAAGFTSGPSEQAPSVQLPLVEPVPGGVPPPPEALPMQWALGGSLGGPLEAPAPSPVRGKPALPDAQGRRVGVPEQGSISGNPFGPSTPPLSAPQAAPPRTERLAGEQAKRRKQACLLAGI
jgi:hypothetical protein